MRAFVLTILFCAALAAEAAVPTIDNDSSCDISLLPAATLLLPYFEVDVAAPPGTGETTVFTVTNTTSLPQIAHVTLWTDYDYPVIDFNLFLTGYDVQSINLYDLIRNGRIAGDKGTGYDVSNVGELSGNYVENIPWNNPLVNEQSCVNLPVQLPSVYITRMQSAFTMGKVAGAGAIAACNSAGSVRPTANTTAVGYATIDVVSSCTATFPTEAAYYENVILFDNVLTGDYIQVNGGDDSAQGNALVHIRAIPEGGAASAAREVNLPRTFYSRFQSAATPRRDARQPLPATFAARWIEGSGAVFSTHYKIWREGKSSNPLSCDVEAKNGSMKLAEMVRFDEDENPETLAPDILPSPPPPPYDPLLLVTSRRSMLDMFPITNDSVAGWLYLNLDSNVTDTYADQSWVVTSMRAEGRFSIDTDATALGNGCSAPVKVSEALGGEKPIGPAPNVRP